MTIDHRAVEDFFNSLMKIVQDLQNETPEDLYHFTDVGGLRGMVEKQKFWATHALAQNDASECEHGISVAEEHLKSLLNGDNYAEGAGPPSRIDVGRDCETLKEKLRDGTMFSFNHADWKDGPFIVSFCTEEDKSSQWLNYGRRGEGVALKFNTGCLDSFFGEAVYTPQVKLQKIVAPISHFLQWTASEDTREVGAMHLRRLLQIQAALLKHHSFENEQEWRLIAAKKDSTPPRKIEFREKAGKLVPYVEVEFKPYALEGVVLGYSCASTAGAVQALLKENGFGEQVEVTRSEVPVRPF